MKVIRSREFTGDRPWAALEASLANAKIACFLIDVQDGLIARLRFLRVLAEFRYSPVWQSQSIFSLRLRILSPLLSLCAG
jgi:predicted nucleotide-binding protein